jgi:hypothetical protein
MEILISICIWFQKRLSVLLMICNLSLTGTVVRARIPFLGWRAIRWMCG